MKQYTTKNRYLAYGLSFIGFYYEKIREGRRLTYSFEDTPELREALEKLNEMKIERKRFN